MRIAGTSNTYLAYFDVNVFRDLAENRVSGAHGKVATLREGISRKKISISTSFECFAEVAFALNYNACLYKKLRELYYDLADWNHILKDAGQVFGDDILTFAEMGKAASPFVQLDESCPFMKAVKTKQDVLPESVLRSIIDKSHKQSQRFINNVLTPAPLSHLKADYDRKDFLRLWEPGNTAEIMVSDFARKLGVLEKCKSRGLMKLLELPTIRLGIGYILHSWYKQVSSDAQMGRSCAYDFRHAVLAGAVGNIVTQDRKLRNAIKTVPGHKVKAWILDQFITKVV